jgi:hypothetical protein
LWLAPFPTLHSSLALLELANVWVHGITIEASEKFCRQHTQ